MANILTYGTFDLLHAGHIRILQNAAQLGNNLFVGVSTDEFNLWKGKVAYECQLTRRANLQSLSFVRQTFWETQMDQKINDILRFDIKIFVMGDDWSGEFDYLENYCEVKYFPRTPGISSTILRNQLRSEACLI